ncbi:Ubiquitin-like modifier-activating enzyme ATG7 [Nymphon striatum]|nr:Ubiquitin-like modifier-activating enzyme ATG7 [Nymphon striatum]
MRCQANYVLINSGPFLCIRGEMEMQLQFAPFASAVDHGFWFNLNKKKLDVFKLNTNAVEIFGYYKNDTLTDLPPCLNVDYTAFEKNVNVLPNAIHMQGNLLNYNTSEDLKNSDKKEMIDDLGKKDSTTTMSTIGKLGKLKSANKGQMTKLENKFESVLTELAAMSLTSSEGRDKIATLQSCITNIENKITYLKDIDDKIVDLAEEDEIENMVCDFDDYYNDKNDVLQKFKNKFNQMLNASTESANPSNRRETQIHSNKSYNLPKLSLTTFDGTLLKWQTFYDDFKSAVHNNTHITNIEKFQYLRCQLIGDAAKVIDGLPLTELNYEHALQILENRYGKKQQLVAAYMKGLWELPSPNFSIKSLQYFHDKLETYVRGLQSLGKNEDHYGELLVPIILEKLPNQTRKTISREHGNEEWNLPTLRKLILKEIEIMQAGEITETIQRDYTEFNQATAAFQTNVKKYTVYTQSCVFCKGKHSSNKCHAISSPEKRYEIVVRERLCFNCLGKHHIKYCKSKYNCQHCNKKHHSAICRNIKHQPQEDKSNEITSNVTNQHDTDSLTTHAHLATNYVPHKISKSSVILKTATAKISSQITTIETVILFDEGATRTFITEETVKKLKLKPTHAEVIHLSIFGDNSPRSKKLNVVLFNLETKYGPNLQIKAMVVPQISTPMKVMTQQVKELPHIKHLDLAQHITADDVEISLLIGADYYWDIIGDHVVKGPGPTAVSSSLGYVLSGPFQTESFSKRTFVQSYWIIDQTNDYLSKFWDLDSIGIKEHDMHSQQSNDLKIFENKYIEKNESKYISRLPWKNDHSPLPSNYLPTLNRTRKMIRKLFTDNVKLYNQIILDYEKRKFIEKVDNENVHEGHYLPHRAVHKESLTTPIRIVFDCSYKTQDNPSLNDCLQKEPRLHNAPMNDSSKFPILLPRQSKLCKLIILNAHERVKHFGLHATVNYLRQRFWIAKIRVSVKSVINKCVICKRVNGFPYRNMLNAPLPSCRLEKSPPFTVTGVDFTGEMYVKTNTEEHKCYVCLFTCANTRAIHLELISDMSTQTFLRAFRRFAARRSIPKIMISDNASTFQFANGELQNLIENADIKHYMCNQHLIWKFIPKRAAWYGGFWERLIGITKTTLKKILGRAFITYDELQTIWNDIKSGTTLKDPTLLNRFLIISYADLKKFHYYYWFAFPAITFSNYTFTYKSLKKMSEVFTTSQILEIQKQYDGLSQKSHFLVEILNDVLMLHSLERLNDLKTFQGKIMVGFSDPSSLISNPGWPLRNFLAQISYLSGFDGKDLEILCFRDQYKEGTRHSENSIVITVHMPKISLETESTISFVGWERNERHKFGPRLVNLSKTMDPVRISESAVDLNLKLIRWRIIPELDLNLIKDTKCLLLGSGTLGCNIARCLLGWGVRNITFVDNSTVSYSNPVRQSLFKFEDSLSGETSKSIAAAESLKLIFPGVNSVGVNLSVPMPGHSISSSVLTQTKEDVEKLENLIDIHDVVFLLMDTRESRWLPTLIASSKQKITINAALGFDSYLVMRHGVKLEETSTIPEDNSSILGSNLGCYFCNDVVAPADSTRDRTLDQACTVSRPGVSMIAAALATELLMSLLQHPDRGNAPANLSNDYIDEEKFCSVLGIIPHQIRGFLSQFSQVLPATSAFDKCTACSSIVRERYEKEGFEFLLQAFNDSEFLENVSGLTALKNDTLTAELWELDD